LTGLDWAEHNYGLDEGCDEALSEAATLHCSGVYKPQAHKDAVQLLLRLADEKEFLGGDDLLELHRALLSDVNPQAGQFRQQSATPLAPGHEPTEAELVGPVIDNALGWFQSESFGQMHEVEKSALMLIKLLDVQPFDDGNGRTLRLFSNFFLLKAGYPPAIIRTSQASEYALAVQSSLRFDTQPIIDLIADAADRSLRWCLGEPPAPPKLKVLSH
jgi:Fic family protein